LTSFAATQTPPPAPPSNDDVSFLTCAATNGNIVTCTIATVAYFAKVIIGKLIVLLGELLTLELTVNQTLFASPIVQLGFSVMLSIANLGFVLGIIIIALATILRSQSYGVKQLLWKLAVMAILVNFGLVIAAPIVGFSDNLTGYFMKTISNGTPSSISDAIFASMSIQKLSNPIDTSTDQGNQGPCSSTFCRLGVLLYGGPAGAAWYTYKAFTVASDKWFYQAQGLVFQAIMLGIIAFTIGALCILLLIRYIYLTFLLILIPVAWLSWIFPKTNRHFSEWWGHFIRWTFFPVITIFFLYLALLLSPAATNGPASGYLQKQFGGGSFTGFAADFGMTVAADLLICGIAIGGLFAANKLSIKGADTAVHAGKWVGGQVKGYATKQTKKGVRAATYKAGSGASNFLRTNQTLAKIPILGRGASLAGRGLQSVLTNKAMVEEAKKKVPKNPEEVKKNLRSSMNTEDTLAHISSLRESGDLTPD
ncbi:MAG: hypothetical protein ACREGC_02065, partial [Minisyncoccia bacterium]